MSNKNSWPAISVLILLYLSLVNLNAQNNNKEFAMMPVPAQIKFNNGKFKLDSAFTIAVRGNGGEKLYRYATQTLRRLAGRTGLFFSQDYLTSASTPLKAAFNIHFKTAADARLDTEESYNLIIRENGIDLHSETSIGAMRGLETFLQLLSADTSGYYFPAVEIKDRPRFPWRGLMIDASRHFMPVDVIKRNLDAMAAVKLNVFHWHLSDDQGFRVESKVYPNLHLKGSDGYYYTQNQVRDVIAYAAGRGIRVIPEFDVPGHTTAMIYAYPQLGSGPAPEKVERKWGIMYQALNPASAYTYTFLDSLFGEMAALFPDPYFHIGGDELEHGDYHEARHWNENTQIQAFMKENTIENNSALQAYFNSRLLEILNSYDKIMVGWDEILHENMPVNIVIQSWRGREAMEKAAKLGYQSILSNGYYIDLIYPARDHYLNDPLPADIDLSGEQKKLVLGGEATMWAEYVTPETIDSRIWPRTAAIAERLWSAPDVNDVRDMYRRLDKISFQLEEHGLTHIKNQAMLLRRLTGNRDISSLKTLVDVIEPLKQYRRGQKRPYTSYSPLTRVVDAALPDAPEALRFNYLVNDCLDDKAVDRQAWLELKEMLMTWKMNHDKLKPVIDRSPVLEEIETLSEDLSLSAGTALQALEYIEKKQQPAPDWLENSSRLLDQASRSRGQTELAIMDAIRKLIQAAS